MRRLSLSLTLCLCCALVLGACAPNDSAEIAQVMPTLVEIPTLTPASKQTLVDGNPIVSTTPILLTSTPPSAQTAVSATPAPGTVSFTPSMTITDTPTLTPSPTHTLTVQPNVFDDLIGTALNTTQLPPGYFGTPPAGGIAQVMTPTFFPGQTMEVGCMNPPSGGFGIVFASDQRLKTTLGCPVGVPPVTLVRVGASQLFEFGLMAWVSGAPSEIYVFYTNGTFQRHPDTFTEGVDPASNGETPPSAGLIEPVRGFGKIWRMYPEVRSGLGWATQPETAATATTLNFERDLLLHLSIRTDVLVIAPQGTGERGDWRAITGAP
ncbi:MAG: hypothetical protein H7Y11_11810 [Armatimonadetes bacterium]|nr:hypothetical protein [Anaerolineae bacterium]